MDANGTRYHLLLGNADWSRGRTADGAPAFVEPTRVYWNALRNEVTLWPETFRFPNQRGATPLPIESRRGAARDQFGNWYWISPDETSIQVFSSGSRATSTFWPPAKSARRARDDGEFHARDKSTPRTRTLRGLAVTEDHYLVAGAIDTEGGRGSIVVFDLYSGGPARRRDWPVAFTPFDLTPRVGGGVWILDRTNRRVWELDRRFEIVSQAPSVGSQDTSGFSAVDGDGSAGAIRRDTVRLDEGWQVPGPHDVIAVAALPREGDGVLVLARSVAAGSSSVRWLVNGAAHGPAVSTTITVPDGPPITLAAHDFALGARNADDPEAWVGRLYIVANDGNQSYAYGVELGATTLKLHELPEYYPMRLFGARAVVAATDGTPWYDSGDQWVPLVLQNRPRYADTGEFWTPVFDGREPGCVWHRLLLDACIPPGTTVDVYTRAADDWRAITLEEWLSDADRAVFAASSDGDAIDEADLLPWRLEPRPYLRGDGSELPFVQSLPSGGGRGTWELLFQQARGRYLQIKLVLSGDGRSTPRIRALRAWYPRFSYLEHYLPAVYSEQPDSASFVDRFMANVEGIFTAIEDRIAAAQLLFDIKNAPAEALDWLGRWFGVAMDPLWEDARRRLLLRHAMDFFQARGTIRGLQMALRLALDECVDDRVFAATTAPTAAPIRIIERFRGRRTPAALLGDVKTAVPGPQRVTAGVQWTPSLGVADLNRRYRDAFKLGATEVFPVVGTAAPVGWSDFAQQTLGFAPRVGATERAKWQQWLRLHFQSSVTDLRANQGGTVTFDSMRLPLDEPASPAADTWTQFLAASPNRERAWWQDFLARRYRTVAALNAAWRTQWTAFSHVSLPDVLPSDGAPLTDWFQFEGTVIAMHGSAHRFTVMLPIRPNERIDTPTQQRRLALAKTVLDLEKPAHTVYDMRFYWAMFRLGEARLGDDTLIGLGSRAPELMGPMILGSGYLAESFLAAHTGADAPSRLQIGRDRVGRSARLGGP